MTVGKLMLVGSTTGTNEQANVSDDGQFVRAILMYVAPGPNGGGNR